MLWREPAALRRHAKRSSCSSSARAAVTRVGETHVPDEIHARVAAQFDEAELVALTFGVAVVNGWNRLAVSFRAPAGSYQPRSVAVQNSVVA